MLQAYLDNRATASEFHELMGLLQVEAGDHIVEEVLQQRLEAAGVHPGETQVNWERMAKEILRQPAAPVRRILPWRRIAVAASIVLAVSISSYFLFFNKKTTNRQEYAITPKNDIAAPVSNRATLTLANGKIVYLDSMANGLLAEQADVHIVKQADGQITYENNEDAGINSGAIYHTLYNPRGSKAMHLTLSDGSTVWLNAESSLRYPAVFTGGERSVEITGEAFFEITKRTVDGARMPFVVRKGDVSVTVLGTRFNVNAYEDEKDIKVTLAEGAVNVMVGKPGTMPVQSGKLAPGQQAQIPSLPPRHMKVKDEVDLEKFTAWKENLFIFSGDDIQTIMRQLARWYNVEVVYKDAGNSWHFTGIISRSNNISEVLKMLEATGKVRFDIEKDKVVVAL